MFCCIHTCILYNVLPHDGLQKRSKHVAVIFIIKVRLCLMGKNGNISRRDKIRIRLQNRQVAFGFL
jgi:hypothetical protein